jgi:DNA-binding MarR family transcriptional regulator
MTDESDHFTQRICFSTYATNRAFGRYYQATIADTGLTYLKFAILNTLKDAGPLTISDLSNRASVEPNTLSPLLKKMAAFGTITRERAPEDERRVIITLTDMGRTLLERADSVVQQGFAELDLDYEQAMQAMQFLKDLREKLDNADPPKLTAADIADLIGD